MNIRLEREDEYFEVENLVREAFWNKYQPGCSEHLVLHNYRDNPDFVKELDYVVEENGRVIAQIMYAKSKIQCEKGDVEVLEFGPVCVSPELQGRGVGSTLITFTLERAAELGYGAVAITGNPDYYHRFGFVSGSSLGIRYIGVPEEDEFPFFMIKELKEGYLKGITGKYIDPDGYNVTDEEADEFDKRFSPKEKKVLPGQLR